MNPGSTSWMETIAKPVWTLEENLLINPIRGLKIAFGFPAFGPGSYAEVVKQVRDNKQRLPTGEQTAFMLDEAYNSTNSDVKNSPRMKFVRDTIMRTGVLWVPNVNVWTPKHIENPGMYKVFDEKGEGLTRVYTRTELEDRLSKGQTERGVRFSQDRTVAFAPLNTIRAGNHTKGTLAYDGAYIANYDVDGAEKLDCVAHTFTLEPSSCIVNNESDDNVQRRSSLYRYRNADNYRLVANFYSYSSDGSGYVVSVSGSR